MKTAIIDRSLCGMKFYSQIRKKDVYTYVSALLEAGADYIEVDINATARLPLPNESDNYIYRISSPGELEIVNAHFFKYAVLPLKFSYLLHKINVPVILEVNIGDVDLLTYLKIVSDNIDFTKISLLRLTGDFRDEINMEEFLLQYNCRYCVPVDICPTNDTMQALSVCVSSLFFNANSITLSFGDSDNFAPFEEFLITMATTYKIILSSSYISGICKAAVISSLIGNIENNNMQSIIKLYQLAPKKISQIDEIPEDTFLRINPSRKTEYKTVFEKQLESLNVDDEVFHEIKDISEKMSINLHYPHTAPHFLN